VTVYDAAYVAVAELRGARLWTADRRLLRSLAGSPWGALASGVAT
jgi:predicted nucleic acid-binding protein